MKILLSALIAPLVLAGGGVAALGADVVVVPKSAPTTAADRQLKVAAQKFDLGRDRLQRADDAKSRSARLNALESATSQLRAARAITVKGDPRDARFELLRDDVDKKLVRSLDEQASIHFERGSFSVAKKRVDEALAIDGDDPRTLNLAAAVKAAQARTAYSFDGSNGVSQARRLQDRRAGVAERPRGLMRRR